MPIEGATVYGMLRRAADGAKGESELARGELRAVDGSVRELLERKGHAFVELARHYLPEMTRPAIEQTMAEVRDELLTVLAEKEREERVLQERAREGEESLRSMEVALDELTARLNEKVRERESLEWKVSEALKSDPAFQERSALAARAEADLHRDEQRAEGLQMEASRKLPSYDKSRLFRYLYDRQFGTPSYSPTGMIRGVDRWLARLIGFSSARVGYDFLKRAPELVAAEVARRREAFHALMSQIEAMQRERSESFGLTAVLEAGRALGAERDQAVLRQQAMRQSIEDVRLKLQALSGTRNRYYEIAIERMRAFLERTGSAALSERARMTPEPTDDNLVAEVRESEEALRSLERDRSACVARMGPIDRLAGSLDELVQRFRSMNFDSSRSFFLDGIDFDALFAALRRGEMDAGGFWSVLEKRQRFRPHRIDVAMDSGDVWTRPESRVLIDAIGGVLGGALRESAARGVRRRIEMPGGPPAGGGFGNPMSFPTSSGGGGGHSHGGSFTSGEGF
jgi:hypothetical protein